MVTGTQEVRGKQPRDASVVIRLSATEKGRLEAYTARKDLRVGQAARHFINGAQDEITDGRTSDAA